MPGIAFTLAFASALWGAAPVADVELADMRGGFRLPTGIEVALTVQSDTSVNGALLLRSVFTAISGTPTLQIFAPASGQTVASSVTTDRPGGTLSVTGGAGGPTVNIITGAAGSVVDNAAAGLSEVPVAAGGASVATAGGDVSLIALPDGARVRLEGAGLDVSHIVGSAFGSVVANSADDRVIDTTTTIGLDLSGSGPDVLGSTMLRVENVAVEAARLGIR